MKPVAMLACIEMEDIDPAAEQEIIGFLFEDDEGEEHEIMVDEMTEEQWAQVYAFGVRADQLDTLH